MAGESEELIGRLRTLVGEGHVLEGELTAGYGVDWTGRFQGPVRAVVRPADTDQVAAVVAACAAAGTAIVAQGGNTGLVGGSVPAEDDAAVVLSLRRLDRLEPVDRTDASVVAGAGVTLAGLQAAARAGGLRFGIDLAARESATVGGMVATNAGGVHVLRFGPMRAQLRGIEAVLGDGSVVRHLSAPAKDNTGYDLAGLLCGSEGTLGVVTAARLRLVPAAGETAVALLGFTRFEDALAAAVHARDRLAGLEAAELFFADGLDLVCDHLEVGHPFGSRPPVYLLVEVTGSRDPTPELVEAFASTGPLDVAVAGDAGRRAALWRYREAHTEAIATLGPPHKLDVALPLGSLASFADTVGAAVATLAPGARCWLFGHALDGNLHVNVSGLPPDDLRVDDLVLGLVAEHGGSISAEHGIGRAKVPWLHLNRAPAELAAMRAVKHALDPAGILNPGVLLPPAP